MKKGCLLTAAFVDETANAGGDHITGVQNVNVAAPYTLDVSPLGAYENTEVTVLYRE